jgi:hypothetical protein
MKKIWKGEGGGDNMINNIIKGYKHDQKHKRRWWLWLGVQEKATIMIRNMREGDNCDHNKKGDDHD